MVEHDVKLVDENLRSHVTFNLEHSSRWNDLDLVRNNISKLSAAENQPEYITGLKTKLSQKRLIDAEAVGASGFCVSLSNKSPSRTS
jgi:hypothetical protein